MIGSQHVAAAAQGLDITAADPSADNCRGRRVQEDVRTTLTIVAPIVEAIPLPGLKAAVGGLLEILKAVDVSSDPS